MDENKKVVVKSFYFEKNNGEIIKTKEGSNIIKCNNCRSICRYSKRKMWLLWYKNKQLSRVVYSKSWLIKIKKEVCLFINSKNEIKLDFSFAR